MIVLMSKPCFLKPWRGPARGSEGQLWKVFHRRLQPWRPHGLCSQLPVLLKTHLGITQEKVSAFYIMHRSHPWIHRTLVCRHEKVFLIQRVH